MTGDSENELEGAGGTPAPTSAEPKAPDEQFHRPRAFRNWASAKEEEKEPSVLSRIGQRISGMFSKSKGEGEGEGEADAEPMELDAAEAELEPAPAPVELEAESVDLEAAPAGTEQEVQWIVSETPVELESEAAEPAPLIEPQFASAPEPAIDSEPVVMWEPDAPSQPEIASEFEILSDSEAAPPAPPPRHPGGRTSKAPKPHRASVRAQIEADSGAAGGSRVVRAAGSGARQ